jgi:hypothetical protein
MNGPFAIGSPRKKLQAPLARSPARPYLRELEAMARDEYLDESSRALEVRVTADDLARRDRIMAPGAAAGPRHPAQYSPTR